MKEPMKEPMKEFGLIQQIQRETSGPDHGVILGIGDDAAVLEVSEGLCLVAATDTLNAGIHFPVDTAPFDIGYKCLAVNLSDLAAMGATPKWVLLSLSLPVADPAWLESFIAGFKSLAQLYDVALVGGDTTHGPLSICLTALGDVKPGKQMLRSGARAGDLVVVSGTIGGAARILELIQAGEDHADRHLLDRPAPRIDLGQVISGFASACIDISDGLLADLGHVLTASRCAARIEVSRLPASGLLNDLEEEQRWN
jgi:thiamine-monophosphate kinase